MKREKLLRKTALLGLTLVTPFTLLSGLSGTPLQAPTPNREADYIKKDEVPPTKIYSLRHRYGLDSGYSYANEVRVVDGDTLAIKASATPHTPKEETE